LKTAIEDYSKAVAITPNDAKLYQNRAIAYRDLGILTGTTGAANYDKSKATDAYNKAVADYEKVLSYDASRKDIQTEVKKAKVYRENLKKRYLNNEKRRSGFGSPLFYGLIVLV